MADRFNTPDQATRLGQQLKNARVEKALTLSQVASNTGVYHGHISRIERGQMATINNSVRKLCTFLKIPCPLNNGGGERGLLAARIDALVTAMPASEPAIAHLIDALEELVGAQTPRAH